eukprot:1627018-Rhodomonas_salina.4
MCSESSAMSWLRWHLMGQFGVKAAERRTNSFQLDLENGRLHRQHLRRSLLSLQLAKSSRSNPMMALRWRKAYSDYDHEPNAEHPNYRRVFSYAVRRSDRQIKSKAGSLPIVSVGLRRFLRSQPESAAQRVNERKQTRKIMHMTARHSKATWHFGWLRQRLFSPVSQQSNRSASPFAASLAVVRRTQQEHQGRTAIPRPCHFDQHARAFLVRKAVQHVTINSNWADFKRKVGDSPPGPVGWKTVHGLEWLLKRGRRHRKGSTTAWVRLSLHVNLTVSISVMQIEQRLFASQPLEGKGL